MDNCPATREVELSATVGDPDVDTKVGFAWTVSAGLIRGTGQKVSWDLSSAPSGTYTANVEVSEGNGLIATDSTKVTIALCPDCITRESPCPVISVICPETAKSNQSMTFEAQILGGDPTVKVTYTWTVSAGKISAGQGSSVITVDVSDVTPGLVTATVSIGGHHPLCNTTASCTTRAAGGVGNPGSHP